jgi:integrase
VKKTPAYPPLIYEFQRYVESVTTSRNTVIAYAQGVASFWRYCQIAKGQQHRFERVQDWLAISNKDVMDWVTYCQVDRKLSRATMGVYTSGLFRWMRDSGIAVPEVRRPKLRRTREAIPEYMDEQATQRYMALADGLADPYKTILLLLPLCGLRIGEIIQLKTADVQVRPLGYVLAVRETAGEDGDAGQEVKTNDRLVPLIPSATAILRRYISGWLQTFSTFSRQSRWLFPRATKVGARDFFVSRRDVVRQFNGLRDSLGMPDLTPHSMRHTYASMLDQHGVDIKTIKERLGHSSITTTDRYVHHSDAALFSDHAKLKDYNPGGMK